jgi:hypothetical protein
MLGWLDRRASKWVLEFGTTAVMAVRGVALAMAHAREEEEEHLNRWPARWERRFVNI